MKRYAATLALLGSAFACSAQMTPAQKTADFLQLMSLYAKNYGPYEWKRDFLKYDALDARPWLDRVRNSKDDLDFYQICVDYVAALQDGHDQFTLPSTFNASLGFNVDIYDGKVLIDSITRSRLPVTDFPFQVGDELLSVDGVAVEDLIQQNLATAMYGNMSSTRRVAAGRIVSRPQSRMPRAHEIGDTATVVIQRQSGELQTFTIPWIKTGFPVTTVGPVPSPVTGIVPTEAKRNSIGDSPDAYLAPWLRLRNEQDSSNEGIINYGSSFPVYAVPAGWKSRLGARSSDFFLSGTFPSGTMTIGLIRIPTFAPPDFALAVSNFAAEIKYMQANTDALVIDVMRNTGGDPCFRDALMRYAIPGHFRTLAYEIRATQSEVNSFANNLLVAQLTGAPQDVIDQYTVLLNSLVEAFQSNRGRTQPVPVCSSSTDLAPASDGQGNVLAYTKPIILLTDEFSVSAAEGFAAVFQDNQRGPIFGHRTNGMGGSVVNFGATNYSEGNTRVTVSLMNRKNPVVTSDYPAAPYVENIGVRPDIEYEYMTKENLLRGGRNFTEAMVAAVTGLVKGQ